MIKAAGAAFIINERVSNFFTSSGTFYRSLL